jgi:hypothetical protein
MADEGSVNMTNGTWSFGQSDLTNFLRVFSGEVALSYKRMTVTDGLFQTRRISHGKSVQWPIMGIGKALRHQRGQSIIQETAAYGTSSTGYLSDPYAAEILIQVDNPLVSSEFISDIDEMMSHYDVRSVIASRLGEALAIEHDLDVLMCICNGAAKALGDDDSVSTNTYAGSWGKVGAVRSSVPTFETSSTAAIAEFKYFATLFNQNDVPQEGRVAIVGPTCYQNLAGDSTLSSADYNRTAGGDIGSGRILNIHGFRVIMSNRIADLQGYTTDYASQGVIKPGQRGTDYFYADFTPVVGLFAQSTAIGTVKLGEMGLRHEENLERLGHLFVSSLTCGNGVLRPSACGVVET